MRTIIVSFIEGRTGVIAQTVTAASDHGLNVVDLGVFKHGELGEPQISMTVAAPTEHEWTSLCGSLRELGLTIYEGENPT